MGLDSDLDFYKAELSKVFEIQLRGRLGEGCTITEIKMLNRVVRVSADGLEYEADPRHVELLAGSMNLNATNSVKTTGVKDPVPDYNIVWGDDQPTTASTFENHLAPSSRKSATGKSM